MAFKAGYRPSFGVRFVSYRDEEPPLGEPAQTNRDH